MTSRDQPVEVNDRSRDESTARMASCRDDCSAQQGLSSWRCLPEGLWSKDHDRRARETVRAAKFLRNWFDKCLGAKGSGKLSEFKKSSVTAGLWRRYIGRGRRCRCNIRWEARWWGTTAPMKIVSLKPRMQGKRHFLLFFKTSDLVVVLVS